MLINKLANFSLKNHPERSRRTECRAASKPTWNRILTFLVRACGAERYKEAAPTAVVKAGEVLLLSSTVDSDSGKVRPFKDKRLPTVE